MMNLFDRIPRFSLLMDTRFRQWILAFSKDGQNLASGSLDGTVGYGTSISGTNGSNSSGHTGGIKALVYRVDNRILACGTGLRWYTPWLWDAGTGGQLSILPRTRRFNKVAPSLGWENPRQWLTKTVTFSYQMLTKVLNNAHQTGIIAHFCIHDRKHNGITARFIFSSPRPTSTFCSIDWRLDKMPDSPLDIATDTELKTPDGAESTVTALTFDPANGSILQWEETDAFESGMPIGGIEQFTGSSFNAITALHFPPILAFLPLGMKWCKFGC